VQGTSDYSFLGPRFGDEIPSSFQPDVSAREWRPDDLRPSLQFFWQESINLRIRERHVFELLECLLRCRIRFGHGARSTTVDLKEFFHQSVPLRLQRFNRFFLHGDITQQGEILFPDEPEVAPGAWRRGFGGVSGQPDGKYVFVVVQLARSVGLEPYVLF
jgi:hypothetical protein